MLDVSITQTQILGLVALESVARLGGYKAASHELCLTVSGLSLRISRLEAQLGRSLVKPDPANRTLRKINPEGRRLIEIVRPLFASLDDALRPAQ